ncbi:MAG: hypothetical protein P1U32_06780 [Legionellaceae bacterium]|nr:hypothetical protein [Legionellaceae bacterium]
MQNKSNVTSLQNRKRLSPIEELPTELHSFGIFTFLPDAKAYNLAVTSKRMLGHYYRSPLRKKQKEASHQLLTHVIQGEEEEALAMLAANPGLLLWASKATDYSGRPYNNYTPFQAAVLCHDVTLWKKMEPYFDKLPKGQEEKARQFNAIFPESIPHQSPYDFSVLVETITQSSEADIDAALRKIQNDTEICRALNQFRSAFTALSMEETFFNPSHIIEVFKVYDKQFDNWSRIQRDLFGRQVIGYIERFLPACFAQVFVQGLCDIVEHKIPLVRSLKFRYDHGFFFPLADTSGLGFDFGVSRALHPEHGHVLDDGGCFFQWCGGHVGQLALEKLCRANTAELLKLEQSVQHGESITDNDILTSLFGCAIF